MRDQGWSEAVSKGLSIATTMRRQYDCHTVYAAGKHPWNFERYRGTTTGGQSIPSSAIGDPHDSKITTLLPDARRRPDSDRHRLADRMDVQRHRIRIRGGRARPHPRSEGTGRSFVHRWRGVSSHRSRYPRDRASSRSTQNSVRRPDGAWHWSTTATPIDPLQVLGAACSEECCPPSPAPARAAEILSQSQP